MHKTICLFIVLLFSTSTYGQQNNTSDTNRVNKTWKQFIIPAIGVGYGTVSLFNYNLKNINTTIQSELFTGNYNKFDDYIQYVTCASVYGLNLLGLKGKNNFKDRTIILGLSYLLMSTSVQGLKYLTKVERPNKENKHSFPSGHTATAFMGAEFLFQEYKDKSIWIGVSGYLVATAVAYGAIYNNRHWFSDVVTGAGFGMLSTKVVYLIYPKLQKKFCKKNTNSQVFMPYFNGEQYGLVWVCSLKQSKRKYP